MGVESATWLSQLDETLPAAGDNLSQADDHMRLIKDVLKNQFTSLGSTAVTATAAEINTLNDTANNFVTSFKTRQGDVSPAASDYDADQVDYDNATSGLAATDVQAAVDEVVSDLSDLATTVADKWTYLGVMSSTGTTLGELTNIPAGCVELEVCFDAPRLNASGAQAWLEIGDSSGYAGVGGGSMSRTAASAVFTNNWGSTGPALLSNQGLDSSDTTWAGIINLIRMEGTHRWILKSVLGSTDAGGPVVATSAGYINNVSEIDRIRITSTTAGYLSGSAYVRARVD